MIAVALFDLATVSMGGFIIRYVAPRTAPPFLVGPLDTKDRLDSSLLTTDCLIGSGHGAPHQFLGQHRVVLLDDQDLPDVTGRVFWLMACESSQFLGPALINAGALSFVGFKEDLLWMIDPKFSIIPWEDQQAGLVMKPIMNGINALLDGKTVNEAYQVQQQGLVNSLASVEDELYAMMIQWDIDNAVVLGNGGASIRPRPKISFPIPPPPLIILP